MLILRYKFGIICSNPFKTKLDMPKVKVNCDF